MKFDVTSLSSKGQVVIPGKIRKKLNLSSGSKFIVTTDGENLLLKPIEKPNKESFDKLIEKSRKLAQIKDLDQEHVSKIIKEVRDESDS